jgi:hypothetical protein
MTRRTTRHLATRRNTPIRRTGTAATRMLIVTVAGCCLAACSHPDTRDAGPANGSPSAIGSPGGAGAASPTLPPPPPPPSLPDLGPSSGFAEDTAVSCAGRPTADQVTAKVRAAGLVASGARVTVSLGPVCAGSWQYTILGVSGREPLQVVTEGQPAALTVVTAGTDVCSTKVLSEAPVGIINVTQCGVGVPPA